MKALVFIAIFFVVSGLIIINNQNLYLVNKEDLQTFSEEYSNWAENLYKNIQSITGQVTKMEWIPNTANLTKEINNSETSQKTEKEKNNFGYDPSDDEFWNSLDEELQ